MKTLITIRVDADVLEWFKSQGPGYQSRMNDALRGHYNMKSGKGYLDVEEYYEDEPVQKKKSSEPPSEKKIIKTVDDVPSFFRPHTKEHQARKKSKGGVK